MIAIPLIGISIYFEKHFIMWALIPLAILIFILGYATFKTNGYSVDGEQITLVYRSVENIQDLLEEDTSNRWKRHNPISSAARIYVRISFRAHHRVIN